MKFLVLIAVLYYFSITGGVEGGLLPPINQKPSFYSDLAKMSRCKQATFYFQKFAGAQINDAQCQNTPPESKPKFINFHRYCYVLFQQIVAFLQ